MATTRARSSPKAALRRPADAALAVAVSLALASCNMLPKLGEGPSGAAPGDNKGPVAVAVTPPVSTAPGPIAPGVDPKMPKSLIPGGAAGVPPPAPADAREGARSFPGTGVFINQKLPGPPAKPGPEEASLNFEALDVREVAKVILGDYLKESYTVHPAVAGTVTFRTIRPIPLRDLLPTLEMLLRQNGAAVVREEGVYKILPIAQVRGSVSPQLGGVTLPIPQGFSVIVVPLKFVGAAHMAKLLEPFAADNTIRIDDVRNLIVLAGNQREMRHLLDTIELFDVDWLAGYSVGIFPIKSAEVKTLMADLDKIFGPTAQGPLAGVVRIVPIERMNALLMITTQPRYLETARGWVEKLDQMGGGAGGSRFYVYQVRNGRAENLATLISDLFSTRRSTTTAAPGLAPGARPAQIQSSGFGPQAPGAAGTTVTTTSAPTSATFNLGGAGGTTSSEVRVIADKDTNSLLILASPADYDVVEGALKKLDLMRRQVLVEVMLAEVTLTDDMSLGIDWFVDGRNNTTGTLSLGSLPSTSAGTPEPFNLGLQLLQRTGPFDNSPLRAVLRARGLDSRIKVLASPQIMVLDNEKAEIKVGDRISVQTQSQTAVGSAGQVVNSYQYLETGILLSVTPRINSGGLVTLEVSQEVSAPGDTQAGNPNPNVSSRNAKTSVVVASGEPIVMAGLIRENNRRGGSGVPLLSKIPILGAAFGSQSFFKDRPELLFIITPRKISDSVQAREATEELRKKLPSLEGMLPKMDTPVAQPGKP
jgi:general secretion pathway protein D